MADADHIRQLMIDALRAYGIDAVPDGPDDLVADGSRFAVDNVVAKCRNAAPEEVPRIVFEHVATLATAQTGPGAADLDDAQFLQAVRARVFPRDFAPWDDAEGFDYVRPVTTFGSSDVIAALCLDFPTMSPPSTTSTSAAAMSTASGPLRWPPPPPNRSSFTKKWTPSTAGLPW